MDTILAEKWCLIVKDIQEVLAVPTPNKRAENETNLGGTISIDI
jgi:hypothetical protein